MRLAKAFRAWYKRIRFRVPSCILCGSAAAFKHSLDEDEAEPFTRHNGPGTQRLSREKDAEEFTPLERWQKWVFGICARCERPNTEEDWCQPCEVEWLQSRFPTWTSGNADLDKIIRESQLNAITPRYYFEWIPYDRFVDVKYLDKGGFGEVFRATWLDGPRIDWDRERKQWVRVGEIPVAIKTISRSRNAHSEFWSEIKAYHYCNLGCTTVLRCYGVTKDPKSDGYMMVMPYAEDGNLHQYIKKRGPAIPWSDRLAILHGIAIGLLGIHQSGLLHSDLHSGNILLGLGETVVADLGLCRHADESSPNTRNVYGVVPYMAPEVLNGGASTAAADIYSFGVLMYELLECNRRPFGSVPHDANLVLAIIDGLRPKVPESAPSSYTQLMQRCWSKNPLDRPSADHIYETIGVWFNQLLFNPSSAFVQELANATAVVMKSSLAVRGPHYSLPNATSKTASTALTGNSDGVASVMGSRDLDCVVSSDHICLCGPHPDPPGPPTEVEKLPSIPEIVYPHVPDTQPLSLSSPTPSLPSVSDRLGYAHSTPIIVHSQNDSVDSTESTETNADAVYISRLITHLLPPPATRNPSSQSGNAVFVDNFFVQNTRQ